MSVTSFFGFSPSAEFSPEHLRRRPVDRHLTDEKSVFKTRGPRALNAEEYILAPSVLVARSRNVLWKNQNVYFLSLLPICHGFHPSFHFVAYVNVSNIKIFGNTFVCFWRSRFYCYVARGLNIYSFIFNYSRISILRISILR